MIYSIYSIDCYYSYLCLLLISADLPNCLRNNWIKMFCIPFFVCINLGLLPETALRSFIVSCRHQLNGSNWMKMMGIFGSSNWLLICTSLCSFPQSGWRAICILTDFCFFLFYILDGLSGQLRVRRKWQMGWNWYKLFCSKNWYINLSLSPKLIRELWRLFCSRQVSDVMLFERIFLRIFIGGTRNEFPIVLVCNYFCCCC